MIRSDDVIRIGRVRKTHGAKGEVLCIVENDLWESSDSDFVVLQCDNILVPFYVEESRYRGEDGLILKLEGIEDERQSQRLCGAGLYVLRSSLPNDLSDTDKAQQDVEGFLLVDARKGELGRIVDTDDSTLNVLWQLEDGTLIPAHEDFVTGIDEERRILYVSLPEGLC
ncbi:MAG TPA: 16S rRNA processing protein RimM [Bacteroidales bacterium]|nr:16S rRNA processing protein RimM [Bacteroidales bacterium]